MPSVSKTQQRLMGSAYAFATGQNKDVPETAKEVAKSFIEAETKGKQTKKSKQTNTSTDDDVDSKSTQVLLHSILKNPLNEKNPLNGIMEWKEV